jgi:hypothetical protein
MLCIFNPEHDLCLANGSPHYVPPASALAFAAAACRLMRCVYPSAQCLPAAAAGDAYRLAPDPLLVPWGWNATLKSHLLRQGIPGHLMPSDDALAHWRQLQHRATLLPLQPDSSAVTTVAEVEALLAEHPDMVLKAPWSGSGRGLRWVSRRLTDHDKAWLDKVVHEQRCAIAESRWAVAHDFALEYRVDDHGLAFIGLSLFETANGVYRGNRLLPDPAIARLVGFPLSRRADLEVWLTDHIVPHYRGPLGIDCILDTDGRHHISEINLRHTMGLVAHEYLRQHPEAEGSLFVPMGCRG